MTIMLRQGQSKGYIELLCHLISNLGELVRKQNGGENRFNSLETCYNVLRLVRQECNAMQDELGLKQKAHLYGPI